MDIVAGLNPEQRRAVEHIDGPMLVVAGAGTGKTQVITRRIAYLLEQAKAKPGEILALTFTEKAAREMEERLYDLIGWQSFQVPVMTFHAFGTELLGRFATHSGRSIRGGLLNDTQKALLLRQHMSRIEMKYYGPQADTFEFVEGVVGYIGALQNAGITVDEYEKYVNKLQLEPGDVHQSDIDEQADLCQLYQLYELVKAETGTFDYNDQLELPLKTLRERPNLCERLAKEYRYVLVDEYQDTNSTQGELLKAFVGRSGNLFAVGDDDQAIYGFRGADINNILSFAQHYELKEPMVLVRNYRSGQEILDASYKLIRHNDPDRLESKLGLNKRLVASVGESFANYQAYRTSIDEQDGVLKLIEARLASGESPAGIAVLASTHAPLKAMAKAMRYRDIPFALSTSVNIFEQPEIIGLWYLMKWLCWQATDEAVGHVLLGPYVGWKPDQLRRVLEISRERLISVEEVLRTDETPASRELVKLLDLWRGWAKSLPVSQMAYRLVFETGRADEWRDMAEEKSRRVVRVFEDLQRLLQQMEDFESVDVDTTLVGYMSAFPKPPVIEITEPVGDAEGVQLLTVHSSKGLEFESVYVINSTNRSWSSGRNMVRAVPEELLRVLDLPPEHEFRRLMYVAVTRARRNLVVSAPQLSAGGVKQSISPFVGELFGDEATALAIPAEASGDSAGSLMKKLQRFYPLSNTEIKRFPFESSDGWMELGVTALGTYEFCPFEFYMQHVLQIKQPMGPQLSFGSTLHKTFEQYYRGALSGATRESGELHGLLDELWSDRGYERRETADLDRQLAHRTLDSFLERERITDRMITGTEVPIRFEIPEAKLRLRGKIDAVFKTTEGVELRDFKTGRGKSDSEKLSKAAKENFQLRTYALAYQLLNDEAPSNVALDYVVTGIEGRARLSDAILKNHREKLGAIAAKIRASEFAPNPSPMHTCSAIRYYGTGEEDDIKEERLAEARNEA